MARRIARYSLEDCFSCSDIPVRSSKAGCSLQDDSSTSLIPSATVPPCALAPATAHSSNQSMCLSALVCGVIAQIRGFSGLWYRAGVDPVATGWTFLRRIHGMGSERVMSTRWSGGDERLAERSDDLDGISRNLMRISKSDLPGEDADPRASGLGFLGARFGNVWTRD